MDLEINRNLRSRRTEQAQSDYEAWRKQAGWYDDDVSMTEYNNGVYDTYYQLDDDAGRKKSGTSVVETESKGLSTFLKVGAIVVAVAVATLLYRALAGRRSSSRDRASTKKGSADTKSRSRSKSASRSRSSRSRSRSRRPGAAAAPGATGANYELMDEKSEARSRKSSRSRSRGRKGTNPSRSRSKNRVPAGTATPAVNVEEKVLV
jgi:hypothetical protein